MLEANPGQAVALDRLWKIYQEQSATAGLLDEYRAAEGMNSFSGAMIHGHLLVLAGKSAEAEKSFRHAADINPKSPQPHLALAQIFQEKSDAKNAAAEYEAAASLMPPTDSALPDVLLKLGAVWLAADDTEKAAAAWERTVALDPKNLELRQRLAENYIASNLPDKALPHYETIVAEGDVQQRALALQNIARIHQMKGDTELAAQSLENAIALTAPDNWLRGEMQARLIRIYQRAHRTGELEQRWEKYAEENPRDPGGYIQLAALYERLGDPDRQREWLEKLCALAPENSDYKLRLANLCAQLGLNKRAADLFDEILKQQPGNADVLFVRAELDLRDIAPQQARERIENFLRAHSDDESLATKAVDFYLRHHMPDAAEAHLKAAAATDENGTLALANFYFSQHRPADAKQALQRLVKNDDPAGKKAAAHSKIAGILKEQKDFQGAQEELAAAIKLQPESPALHLALSDLFTGLGRFDEAQAQAEKALEASKDAASRAEADAKLFQVFQMRAAKTDAEQKAKLPADLMEGIAFLRKPAGDADDGALEKFVDAMAAAAEKNPMFDAMLRVARWQMWRQRTKEALDFAKRAIDLKPDSIEARELFVKIASPEQKALAVEQLREMIKVDPAHEAVYSRQIARLLIETGGTDEALQIFSDIEKAKPGDLDALTDLAAALQQSERWDDAIAAWQRAFDLAPAQRRKEIAASLVRALEHGNFDERAAAVLLKITDEEADDAQRPVLFHDLLAYCTKHDLTGWLQAQYERRLRANADDYFAQVALSKIFKANGRDADALNLLGDAAFSTDDQAPALRELAAEAGEMGDFEAALSYQKRAVLLSRQDDSGDLEKLAELQEAMPDCDAAAQTWEKIAAKFPRDPAVLVRAADFFQRQNVADRARVFLQKAANVEPSNLETLTTLGQLAADAGDRAGALSNFEKVLQNSAPEDGGGQVKFPGVKAANIGRLQQSYFTTLRLRSASPNAETMRVLQSFWVAPDARYSTSPDFRLRAIQKISELLKSGGDKAAMKKWIARWESAQPPSASEALWAFYFSGENEKVVKLLEKMMAQSPKDRLLQQGFVWLALQMREYAALRRWLADGGRGAEERDLVMISLGQLLDVENGSARADVDPKLVDGLFPPEFPARQMMWQAAVLLASKGRLDDAVKLGERVFASVTTQRTEYGLELAHWHIYNGDIDSARRVLRAVISGAGDELDSPIYTALREFFLLMPESERASFISNYADGAKKNPLHSALSLSLLYGLDGDDAKARAELVKLVALRPVSSRRDAEAPALSRAWNFLLTTGLQLQAWKLNALATSLWEMALADSALISLQGDAAADGVRQIRQQLAIARLASATPEECDRLIENFSRLMSAENLFTLANVLENSGLAAQAEKIYLRAWRNHPEDWGILQRLLNASRNAEDSDTEIAVLRESLATVDKQKMPDAAYLQCVQQLARALSGSEKLDEAVRISEEAMRRFPIDTDLMQMAAGLYQQQNRQDEAEKIFRKILSIKPGDANARRMLFQSLVNQNKNADALALMDERGGLAERQPEEIARLYFKTGQNAKAEQEANRLLQSRAFDRIPRMASVLAENGCLQEAASLLQTAIARCKDTLTFYKLESALLDLLPEDAPQTLIDACFARLRSQRAASRASRAKGAERRGEENSYYNALERLSKKFHREEEFTKDLEAEWRGGAGSSGAGLRLLRLYRDDAKKEKLHAVCEALLQRADFNSAMMGNMRGALEAAKQYDLLEKGWRILCEREPLKNDLPFNLARALNSSGKKTEAADVLEKLGARYVFATEVAATVAEEYARMKDFPGAQKWYEVAILQQEPRERPSVFFSYARLLLDHRDFAGAKRILLAVFRGSNSRDMDLLVRYFIESDRVDQIEAAIREFALTPSQTAQATEVLKRFIADSDDNAAKERAKKILSKIQPAPAAP